MLCDISVGLRMIHHVDNHDSSFGAGATCMQPRANINNEHLGRTGAMAQSCKMSAGMIFWYEYLEGSFLDQMTRSLDKIRLWEKPWQLAHAQCKHPPAGVSLAANLFSVSTATVHIAGLASNVCEQCSAAALHALHLSAACSGVVWRSLQETSRSSCAAGLAAAASPTSLGAT